MLTGKNISYNDLKKLEFALHTVIGAELEFYLSEHIDPQDITREIGYVLQYEKGDNQFEINFKPHNSPAELAREIHAVRTRISTIASSLGGVADFRSKPKEDDYGSSMHIHLNFINDSTPPKVSAEQIDVNFIAMVLCYYLPSTIDSFLPDLHDYKRLDEKFMAPTHICYGNNNRTAMIRIPGSSPSRVEHRLPSANANPFDVIYAIISSCIEGFKNEHLIPHIPKIYGNAYDQQYQLQKIVDVISSSVKS
jgi:glutamine synthetase